MKATGLLIPSVRGLSFLAAGLLFVTVGCNRPAASAPQPAATAEATPPAVTTVKPERQTIRHTVQQPGSIQAFEQTPVFSKIAGYVQKMHVDKGDRVSKGAVLAELWVPEMEVDADQKKALVGQAAAEVKQAREAAAVAAADLQSAEAKVQAAEATRLRAEAQFQRAQSQYERLRKAGTTGVIGKEDVEESRLGFEAAQAGVAEVTAQVRSAQAERDASRAKRDKAQADVAVAESRLEVARKNHELAKTMLAYRQVVAPFDGVVTARNVDTGHFVQPATGPKGEALVVVMRTDLMRIRVEVPEVEADWVAKGTPARIRLPAVPSFAFTGPVTRTSWALDRTTRTLLAEIDVPDPDGRLRPGNYAYATLTAERPNVWTLPASAVVTEGDVTQGYRTFCYVVADGKAWRTPLAIGVRDGQRVQVLKKQARPAESDGAGAWQDLTGTEEIVTGDLGPLTDGGPVTVTGPS